jgi:Reverse transcriptase (RNA-dependent DNA polymerase)/Group II intron, maturase-specific domain
VERWLKAPLQATDGEVRARVRGTPQGGVVSPLLANLFLHYAFDVWIDRTLSSVRFCRYADDAVIHCKSQAQAQFVLRRIDERFRECGLELHPNKTRIVYCKDINRQQDHLEIEFTFLGYTFRPRKALDKYGRVYVNFSPAVSGAACKSMRQTIRGWHLQLKCDKELADLSTMFDPILKGWHRYYGRFYGSAMSTIWKHVNAYLVRWHWGRTRRPRRSADATIREETLRNHRYCLGSPKTGCRNRGCEGPLGCRRLQELAPPYCPGGGGSFDGRRFPRVWRRAGQRSRKGDACPDLRKARSCRLSTGVVMSGHPISRSAREPYRDPGGGAR